MSCVTLHCFRDVTFPWSICWLSNSALIIKFQWIFHHGCFLPAAKQAGRWMIKKRVGWGGGGGVGVWFHMTQTCVERGGVVVFPKLLPDSSAAQWERKVELGFVSKLVKWVWWWKGSGGCSDSLHRWLARCSESLHGSDFSKLATGPNCYPVYLSLPFFRRSTRPLPSSFLVRDSIICSVCHLISRDNYLSSFAGGCTDFAPRRIFAKPIPNLSHFIFHQIVVWCGKSTWSHRFI